MILLILTLSMLWANSADDKLMICFLFFPDNMICHFMQIIFTGDSLFEMSVETICMKCQILFSGRKYEKYFSMFYPECQALLLPFFQLQTALILNICILQIAKINLSLHTPKKKKKPSHIPYLKRPKLYIRGVPR